MRRPRRLALLALAICITIACSRRGRGPGPAEALRGDAVWFAEGIGAGDASIEETLLAFRCSAVYLPARRMLGGTHGWPGVDLPAPPRPFSRIPVVLVIEAIADPLGGVVGKRAKEFGPALANEINSALARSSAFGSVRGVHLDIPFSPLTVEPLAAAVREARSLLAHGLSGKNDAASRLARGMSLTLSLRRPPPSEEKEQDALRALASRTDGLVAFVFGGDNASDPAFTDSLGKPWWAGYDSRTTGIVRKSTGDPGARAPEAALDALTEDPRSELRHELPWNVENGAEFSLQAARPLRAGGLTLSEGDSVFFTQPSLADLVARLRAAPAGLRFARGRVVVFGETSDAARLFPIAALPDTLAGRPTAPALRAWVEGEGPRLLRVGGENASPHISVVSRVENWVEVDVAPARVGDVETGGFDRWEAYDSKGRLVSPGRASRLRLYETLVAPFEWLEPARVRVRGNLPSPCCPVRVRAMSAAGGEVQTDWSLPGPVGDPAVPAP